MSGGPELFVVCRSCGSEVSPYVTECPYCGTRVRKRAPKLEHGTAKPKKARSMPRLSPLRHGEIPGISGGPASRPYATIVIVTLSLLGYLIWALAGQPLESPSGGYQRLVYAPFIYMNGWYQLAVLLPLGLFGWLLESRHGWPLVVGLFLLFGIGGSALSVALDEGVLFLGAPGAALAMLAVWAVPDVKRLRRQREYDGDLLGTAMLALVVALMPVVVPTASAVATYVGLLGGAAIGLLLSRSPRAR